MYNTETSNWDRIWASRGWNIDFQPIFIVNRLFLIKPKANPLGFEMKVWYFSKYLKNYVQYRNVYLRYNMSLTGMKYIFSAHFHREHFQLVFIVNKHFTRGIIFVNIFTIIHVKLLRLGYILSLTDSKYNALLGWF
jgi:hypothetical protein